jgi:hypothetical protein
VPAKDAAVVAAARSGVRWRRSADDRTARRASSAGTATCRSPRRPGPCSSSSTRPNHEAAHAAPLPHPRGRRWDGSHIAVSESPLGHHAESHGPLAGGFCFWCRPRTPMPRGARSRPTVPPAAALDPVTRPSGSPLTQLRHGGPAGQRGNGTWSLGREGEVGLVSHAPHLIQQSLTCGHSVRAAELEQQSHRAAARNRQTWCSKLPSSRQGGRDVVRDLDRVAIRIDRRRRRHAQHDRGGHPVHGSGEPDH